MFRGKCSNIWHAVGNLTADGVVVGESGIRTDMLINVVHNSLESIQGLSGLRKETDVLVEIKAVDLSLINPNIGGLKHGTMVRVLSTPHDIDAYMLCRKVDINLNEPDDAVYSLGAETITLSGQQANAMKNIVLAAGAADYALTKLSGLPEEEQEGEEDAYTE